MTTYTYAKRFSRHPPFVEMISCPKCGRSFQEIVPRIHKPTSCPGSTAKDCNYKDREVEL